ncbi:MAG: hypothetical protein CMN03_13710 [Roseibacillus sp.]|nr:hypothetical protein [Roseibacillus sp.]
MRRSTFLRNAVLVGGGSMVWMPRSQGCGTYGRKVPHHWMPHVRPVPRSLGPVEVRRIDAAVDLKDQVGHTSLTITFFNPAGHQQEGGVLLPVPAGAGLKSFAMEGGGKELKADILPVQKAREIYNQIVAQSKDPAILEFAGYGAVSSSVFPIPPRSECRLRIVYEELLQEESSRIDYVLPRSESHDCRVKWSVDANWEVKGGVATTYSPSHEISPVKTDKGVHVSLKKNMEPGPFRLSVLRRRKKAAAASFLTHHGEKNGEGYFLLLMAAPDRKRNARPLRREVTLVIDRSGSMAGEKMDQVRTAALQIVEGLEDGEYFNLITYNEGVDLFSSKPVLSDRGSKVRARKFIREIRVSGGTNIDGALKAAISQPVREGVVPMVLFLTDGLPTIGETSERKIREKVRLLNSGQRRIFTFGVGVDVNTPLLSSLADDSRALPTYVLPGETVEVKVASVFRKLRGPVLGFPELKVFTREGKQASHLVSDLVPGRLPDFFAGDQVIVTGRYRGAEPLEFRITGHDGTARRTLALPFKAGSGRNPFVPRLWAMRRIGVLTSALRDLGAESSPPNPGAGGVDRDDPRVRELVDEIVRLSTEYGVLSEYTAFLALEGEVFSSRKKRVSRAAENYDRRGLKTRSGASSVNQDLNLWSQRQSESLNRRNYYVDEELNLQEIENVAQCADMTFFRRGSQWVDARLAAREEEGEGAPAREIKIGSKEFNQLVDRLVRKQRQSCLALGRNLELVVDGVRYQIK